MYCENCGSKLNENDKYCSACGNFININDTNNNNSIQNSYVEKNCQSDNVVDFNEKFIKSYIGDKADKMYDSVKNGGINIWALLFGIIYFIYRKMYLVSIIIIILVDVADYLIPSISSYIGSFAGIIFCPIYKWDITRKLRKIKRDNLNADENQLLSIAQNKGGTTIIGIILFFAIYFLIMLFIFKGNV